MDFDFEIEMASSGTMPSKGAERCDTELLEPRGVVHHEGNEINTSIDLLELPFSPFPSVKLGILSNFQTQIYPIHCDIHGFSTNSTASMLGMSLKSRVSGRN